MTDRSEQQKQLFDEWKYECMNLSHLNAIIQNDFKRLYEDGYLIDKGLQNDLLHFNTYAIETIAKLNDLRIKIISLCNDTIKEIQ